MVNKKAVNTVDATRKAKIILFPFLNILPMRRCIVHVHTHVCKPPKITFTDEFLFISRAFVVMNLSQEIYAFWCWRCWSFVPHFISFCLFRSLKHTTLQSSSQVLSQLVVYTHLERFAWLRRRCSTGSGVCGGGTWFSSNWLRWFVLELRGYPPFGITDVHTLVQN